VKKNGQPIRRLDAARVDFLRDVIAAGEPLIIGRSERGWRKLPRWTPELLAERLGRRSVEVAVSPNELFDYAANHARYELTRMAFDALVQQLLRPSRRKPHLYLMQQPLEPYFPELDQELRMPSFLAKLGVSRQLWLGARGNRTPLHYDTGHNLFSQIHGRKRFMLFDPTESAHLYPYPRESRHRHVSRIDPERPDLRSFPSFSRARARELVLEPGEHLFLPAGFWHHVRSLDVTISVNAWWTPRPASSRGKRAEDPAGARKARDRLRAGPRRRRL